MTLTLTSPAVIAAAKALQEHEGRCWPTDEQHQVFHQKRALACLQGAGVGELVEALESCIGSFEAIDFHPIGLHLAHTTLAKFTGA